MGKGEKKKKILELWKEGKTYTEIMKETGYSMAWVREAVQREKND